jgi:hypothetical protein
MVYVGIGGTGLDIGRSLEQMLRDEITGPDGRRLIARGGSFGNFEPKQLPGFIQSLYLDFSEQEIVTLQTTDEVQIAVGGMSPLMVLIEPVRR